METMYLLANMMSSEAKEKRKYVKSYDKNGGRLGRKNTSKALVLHQSTLI